MDLLYALSLPTPRHSLPSAPNILFSYSHSSSVSYSSCSYILTPPSSYSSCCFYSFLPIIPIILVFIFLLVLFHLHLLPTPTFLLLFFLFLLFLFILYLISTYSYIPTSLPLSTIPVFIHPLVNFPPTFLILHCVFLLLLFLFLFILYLIFHLLLHSSFPSSLPSFSLPLPTSLLASPVLLCRPNFSSFVSTRSRYSYRSQSLHRCIFFHIIFLGLQLLLFTMRLVII